MFALERQKIILEKLNLEGAVWVSKLSAELGVTEETIRRDLEKLENKEVLLRTHGGAVPITDTSYELSLEKRKQTNLAAKERLAKLAAQYILPGDTIFLDSSTTTFYIAKEIKKMKNITVISNSLRVINELSNVEDIKTVAVGGIVSNNQSMVGYLAENSIETNFYATKFFFSSKGVSPEAGIMESNDQECAIKKQMITNSTEKYYLCDASKIGRVGFYKLTPINEVDYFITEAKLGNDYLDTFIEYGVKYIQAE